MDGYKLDGKALHVRIAGQKDPPRNRSGLGHPDRDHHRGDRGHYDHGMHGQPPPPGGALPPHMPGVCEVLLCFVEWSVQLGYESVSTGGRFARFISCRIFKLSGEYEFVHAAGLFHMPDNDRVTLLALCPGQCRQLFYAQRVELFSMDTAAQPIQHAARDEALVCWLAA